MPMNDELKALIIANLDVVEFFDLLGIELADILDFPEIEELCEENEARLYRAVG
jgi:hypothetical protein